jgi:ATP-binding cassette subfamily C protein CydCD
VKPLDPRLLRFSRSSRGFLLLSVLLALIGAVLSILQAVLLTRLITHLFQNKESLNQLLPSFRALILIFILKAILGFLTNYIGARFSTKIKSELREGLINKVIGGDTSALHDLGPAQLSLLVSRGINNLDGYFSKFIPQLFIASTLPIIVGIAITYQDWKSGLIVLFTIPLIPMFGILIGRFTAQATTKKIETLGLLSGYFLDLLSGLPTLKVYNRSKLQTKKLGEIGDQYRKETMKVLRISFLSSLALELVATLSVALLAVSIGIRLVNASMTLSAGLMVLILAPEVYWPIRQVAAHFHAAEDGVAVSNQIFDILESQSKNGTEKISDIKAITWSELTVAYPNRSTIKIPAGQLTAGKIHALVGPSGSGKSTLISVLLGFTKVTTGEIVVSTSSGDISFEQIEKNHWRSFLSWMPQDPHFASTTVKEIIGGNATVLDDVSLELKDLPQGLDTHIGALQDAVSTGQRRKLALARALAKQSSLMILDEPTASVDDISEEQIARSLESQAALGRIVLVSSHRPTVIASADNTIKLVAR